MATTPDNQPIVTVETASVLPTRTQLFTLLYNRHAAEIQAFCRRRLPAADVDDVVAEVFTVAWRRLDELDPDRTRGWLYGVARGVAANHLRSAQRRHRLERRAITTRPSVASPGVDDWTETDPGLQHAIAALRSADREILLLAAWEGLDGAELAAALEITPAAAHQRLHRARARLQRRLDRTGAPE